MNQLQTQPPELIGLIVLDAMEKMNQKQKRKFMKHLDLTELQQKPLTGNEREIDQEFKEIVKPVETLREALLEAIDNLKDIPILFKKANYYNSLLIKQIADSKETIEIKEKYINPKR